MPIRIDDAVFRLRADAEAVRERLEGIEAAEAKATAESAKRAEEAKRKEGREVEQRAKKKGGILGTVAKTVAGGINIAAVSTAIGSAIPLLGPAAKATFKGSLAADKLVPILPALEALVKKGELPSLLKATIQATITSTEVADALGMTKLAATADQQNKALSGAVDSLKEFLVASGMFGHYPSQEQIVRHFNAERHWNTWQLNLERQGKRAFLRSAAQANARNLSRGVNGR